MVYLEFRANNRTLLSRYSLNIFFTVHTLVKQKFWHIFIISTLSRSFHIVYKKNSNSAKFQDLDDYSEKPAQN